MKKLVPIFIVLLCCLYQFMCSKDPTQSEGPQTEWKTVFYDDFNRVDAIDGDLGSNWIACKTEYGHIMQIKNNEIYAVREIPQLGAPETYPYALYIQEFDHIVMRISLKARTDSEPNYPVFMLFAGADSLLDEGYFFGYKHDAFHSDVPNRQNIAPYDISANTTYVIKLTVKKNHGYKWEINDSDSGRLLHYGGTDDELHISGRIGFMAGAPSPNAVYIDDFRIEIPE